MFLPILMFGFLGVVIAGQEAADKTVLDGVFTADQASRGADKFEANCSRCHEGLDPDGPNLVGRSFIDRWREDSLDTLFGHISTRMPPDGAARLSKVDYLEILSHLLHENGYPEGSGELTEDEMENILLVGQNGPQPLPTNSLVRVVGCFTENADTTWTLTDATRPSRTRNGNETTDEELKQSAARRPGTRTFRLQNFSNIGINFDPSTLKGHRVQVKGVLIRQSTGERITPTSLQSLAATCGS